MEYQFGSNDTVVRLDDNAIIPADPDNADYREYLAWVEAGNTAMPRSSQTSADAKSAQVIIVETAYRAAAQQPVSYMQTMFQADVASQAGVAKALVAGAPLPPDFFWLDAANRRVPMTFVQLQGLAGAMLAQRQAAFAKKTTLKEQIRNAEADEDVQAVTWD
ncbi:DUF4376 domain-containing protein [Ralstonia pseudosolanacearum]|uniref:DUF4376 domain-containing protein n=1 Tax=Ralstonia pseudosolanacearum TaxID=1310165 RepID=UPI003CF7ADA4